MTGSGSIVRVTPRYAPHLVFPDRPYRPGEGPHPKTWAAPTPPPPPLTHAGFAGHEEFLFGVDLLNHGFDWEAHEAWEDIWRVTPKGSPERLLLQGLIQVAAAKVKRTADARRESLGLAERATEKLRRAAEGGPEVLCGIVVSPFADAVDGWAREWGETGALVLEVQGVGG